MLLISNQSGCYQLVICLSVLLISDQSQDVAD